MRTTPAIVAAAAILLAGCSAGAADTPAPTATVTETVTAPAETVTETVTAEPEPEPDPEPSPTPTALADIDVITPEDAEYIMGEKLTQTDRYAFAGDVADNGYTKALSVERLRGALPQRLVDRQRGTEMIGGEFRRVEELGENAFYYASPDDYSAGKHAGVMWEEADGTVYSASADHVIPSEVGPRLLETIIKNRANL